MDRPHCGKKTPLWTETPLWTGNPLLREFHSEGNLTVERKPLWTELLLNVDRNPKLTRNPTVERNLTVDRNPTSTVRCVSESLLNPTRKGTIRTEILERKMTGRERRAHRTTTVILYRDLVAAVVDGQQTVLAVVLQDGLAGQGAHLGQGL